ncbi:tetratricopeptide repeat protein [Thalassobaculum litoreum]|uniref:Tfp pilus assembly protein PilF n=1 Tax=Thalassobaculum litoreum DSM 18839 TaxID=1123362 RepID=A0A8G2EZY5_9PROT|nr:tetratricopeptide repeat protein [Thalassobaculum litoreum]SDG26144.1 Tfp pilus assembly protein PilF [Thalassobaculum litoreum DSM 18839]
MDFSLIAYGISVYAGVLALSTYAYFGLWEIEAEAIPPYLADQGYTPKIFVNHVIDQIDDIRLETASESQTDVVKTGKVTPAEEVASYFGVTELIRAGQESFGLAPPRIELEVIQRDKTAFWRVRGNHALYGPTMRSGKLDTQSTEQLFETLAHHTISFLSPFEGAAHDLVADSRVGDYSETIATTSALLRGCDSAPTFICTQANVRVGHTIRGLANLNAGDARAAFEDLQTANEISGKDAVATAFLGDVLRRLDQEDAAQKRYEEALALDSDVGQEFVSFARGLAKAGNMPLAVERFETAARLNMEGAEFLASWGESLAAMGEYEDALAKYLQAENLDTETDLFAEKIEELQQKIGEIDKSKSTPPDVAPAPIQGGTTTE